MNLKHLIWWKARKYRSVKSRSVRISVNVPGTWDVEGVVEERATAGEERPQGGLGGGRDAHSVHLGSRVAHVFQLLEQVLDVCRVHVCACTNIPHSTENASLLSYTTTLFHRMNLNEIETKFHWGFLLCYLVSNNLRLSVDISLSFRPRDQFLS